MIVSTGRQRDSAIHIHVSILPQTPSHPGCHISLSRGEHLNLWGNILSRLVIAFLPGSKHLLISWLQSPSAMILEPPKIKSDTVSPSVSHEVMGADTMILVFWMLSFKPTFSLSSLIKLYFLLFQYIESVC